jgi:hypothetical protein
MYEIIDGFVTLRSNGLQEFGLLSGPRSDRGQATWWSRAGSQPAYLRIRDQLWTSCRRFGLDHGP